MLLLALNALFAYLFFLVARANIPKGIAFLKVGWLALQVFAPKARTSENTYYQFAVSEGGQFFVGGVFALVTGIFSAALAIVFGIMALRYGLPI